MVRKSMKFISACMLLCLAFTVVAADPLRIDGATEQSAEKSFDRMLKDVRPGKATELQVAVLLIVMDGVGSAKEAMERPELQNPSISLIKDRVNGMTADELIALSKTSTAKTAPNRR